MFKNISIVTVALAATLTLGACNSNHVDNSRRTHDVHLLLTIRASDLHTKNPTPSAKLSFKYPV